MSLTVCAYGTANRPKLFPRLGPRGSYAEADGFEGFAPEVLAAATSYSLSAIITRNGYNLGDQVVSVTVDGAVHEVTVSSFGERVRCEAPTLDVLRAAWNVHMAGVGQWLRNGGLRIRVFPLDAQGKPGEPLEFSSFTMIEQGGHDNGPAIFELHSDTPSNTWGLGTTVSSMQEGWYELTSTGTAVTITSDSLDEARMAWEWYWDELGVRLAAAERS